MIKKVKKRKQFMEYDDNRSGIDDSDEEARNISIPFDPTKITFITQQQSLDFILGKIEDNQLKMDPDYQRQEGIWKFDNKCRLIESLLLKIPIPAFYIYAKSDDEWEIIDGLQRLSIVRDFILGKNSEKDEKEFLKIRSLQYLKLKDIVKPELVSDEVKTNPEKDLLEVSYTDLTGNYQRRIRGTQVTLFIISGGTPDEVIYNVFERINTGGLPLSPQEIRNAIKQGRATKFLKELAESKEFKDATQNKIKPDRMQDRELVLRFIFFKTTPYNKYEDKKDFNVLLLETMDTLNDNLKEFEEISKKNNNKKTAKKIILERKSEKEKLVDDLRRDFFLSMNRAAQLFEGYAFRRMNKAKIMNINKAVFEAVSVILSQINESQFNNLLARKKEIRKAYMALFNSKGKEFVNAVSRSTNVKSNVIKRFETIEVLLK